ncbi:hypothetical protein [Agromyces arachidis]|uniref:hypothetical protein n=1 Tax=Agromyces arachidis TaxID=766966 RepID=UPI004057BEDF
MAGFRAGRRRGAGGAEARDALPASGVGSALLSADERIRAAVEALDFADAELGAEATARLRTAIDAARGHLGEAFRLNRRNQEPDPRTADEVRARAARIVELCETIERVLDEQTAALADRIERARRAPETMARLPADIDRLRGRLPDARETVERLSIRYAREALAAVDGHLAEADQLLGFADHSLRVAERRRAAGQLEHADVALAASAAAVRRAATLLEEVEAFEVDALRAESTLALVVEASRRDLAAALEEAGAGAGAGLGSRGVANAVAELQAALAALPAIGVNTDPFAHLNRVREATAVLDAATTAARERAARPVPPVDRVERAIREADRRLEAARDEVATHPGWVGSEALARLAEAERVRLDLTRSLGGAATDADAVAAADHEQRERAIALAARASELAAEAVRLARRDVGAVRASQRSG